MAKELEGKVAVVTGAASGIGLASTEAMLAVGARVVMVDRDAAALTTLCDKHGDAVMPLVIDLLDPKDCATLLPRVLEKTGQLDILHANAGTYVGGDLSASPEMVRDAVEIVTQGSIWAPRRLLSRLIDRLLDNPEVRRGSDADTKLTLREHQVMELDSEGAIES